MTFPFKDSRVVECHKKFITGNPPRLEEIPVDCRENLLIAMARTQQLGNEHFRNCLEHPKYFTSKSVVIDLLPDEKPEDGDFDRATYRDFLVFFANILHKDSNLAHRIATFRVVSIVEGMSGLIRIPRSLWTDNNVLLTKCQHNFSKNETTVESDLLRIKDFYVASDIVGTDRSTVDDYADLRLILAVVSFCANLRRLSVSFLKFQEWYLRDDRFVLFSAKEFVVQNRREFDQSSKPVNKKLLDFCVDHRVTPQLILDHPELFRLCVELEYANRSNESVQHEILLAGSVLHELLETTWQSARSSLEDLQVCGFDSDDCDLRQELHGKLEFPKLRNLQLKASHMKSDTINGLLSYCGIDLQSLTLDGDIRFGCPEPVQLPELRHLTVNNKYLDAFPIGQIEKLRLQSCRLQVNPDSLSDEHIRLLQTLLRKRVRISLSLLCLFVKPATIEKLIDIADFDITDLVLCSNRCFTTEIADKFLERCRKLHSLKFALRDINKRVGDYEHFLNKCFADVERAKKLTSLELNLVLTAQTLSLLYRNCGNLNVFKLHHANKSGDDQLQLWIDSGAKPHEISFSAANLTDACLNRFIEVCGSNLRRIVIFHVRPDCCDTLANTVVRCCPLRVYIDWHTLNDEIGNDGNGKNCYFSVGTNRVERNPSLIAFEREVD